MSTKKGPRPPSPEDGVEGKTKSEKPHKKKKKRGPRTPAPPRPPSPSDDEEVEVFSRIDDNYDAGSKTTESKTAQDPIHTKVFRSAESDDEEDIGDNAASIMPAGEIDMAELMMNIRSSAPGAIDNHGTPEISLASKPRRGVSASKLDDSDDDFHIPTLGGSPSASETESNRDRERREKRDRRDKRDKKERRGERDKRDKGRDDRSSRNEGKTDRSPRQNYASETDNDEALNAHDRSFQKATRVARSIPDAIVRAVGYHERIIQLMQRDDFNATEQQLQALKTFTKSCKRTASMVEGVLRESGVETSPNPKDPKGRGGRNGRTDDYERSNDFSHRGSERESDRSASNDHYNPKEDAIREESKTDLQELLDDIKDFDNFESSSKGKKNGKKGGRSKRMMAPELAKLVNSPDFNLYEFLREPVPKEYGMVQFRIVGDHSDNELFVLFDYGDEPESSNLVMTCDRARKSKLKILFL
jgi:hypothetical protein